MLLQLKEHFDSITRENTIKKEFDKKSLQRLASNMAGSHFDEVPKVFKCCDDMTLEYLDHCLQSFFAEVRKHDCERYATGSLKDLASMVQLCFQKELTKKLDFWSHERLKKSQFVLDGEMRISARKRHVAPRRRPDCISKDSEDQMWEQNILGRDTPKKLWNTLLFSIGIHCGLRGRLEQYN